MRHSLLLAMALCSLMVSGCAGTLESTLRDAADRGRVPPDLTVVYDDQTPMSGGERIEVTGEGDLRWWRLRPSFLEASSSPEASLYDTEVGPTPSDPPAIEVRVTEAAMLELVRLLLEVEPWEQRAESVEDEGRLDQRRAVLRASVRGGAESVWEWHDSLEDASGRIAKVRRWAERRIETQPAPSGSIPPVEPGPAGVGPAASEPAAEPVTAPAAGP